MNTKAGAGKRAYKEEPNGTGRQSLAALAWAKRRCFFINSRYGYHRKCSFNTGTGRVRAVLWIARSATVREWSTRAGFGIGGIINED